MIIFGIRAGFFIDTSKDVRTIEEVLYQFNDVRADLALRVLAKQAGESI